MENSRTSSSSQTSAVDNVNNNVNNVAQPKDLSTGVKDWPWKMLEVKLANPKQELKLLSTDDSYSDDWQLSKLRDEVWKQFLFWYCVIVLIEESEDLSFKDNLPIVFSNLNFECPHNISAFVRKIRNKFSAAVKKDNVSLMLDLVLLGFSEFCDLGPYCTKAGITMDWLKCPSIIVNCVVTKGLVLELRKVRCRHNFSYENFSFWLQCLCQLDMQPNVGSVQSQTESMYKQQCKLLKLGKDEKEQFLSTKYTPPSKRTPTDTNNQSDQQFRHTPKKNKKETATCNDTSNLRKKLCESNKKRYQTNIAIFHLKKENSKLHHKLAACKNKLSKLSTRNVNKRIKRKEKQIEQLKKEKNQLSRLALNLQIRAEQIRQKYKKQHSLLTYYKNRKQSQRTEQHETPSDTVKTKQNTNTLTSKLNKSRELCHFLENENEILKEKLEEFQMSVELNKIITTFHNGKYVDMVREVYVNLLSLNVGVNNVERVVRLVLEKLGGLHVDRLPKRTLTEIMLVEAKTLAQMQAAEAMLLSKNNTIHTDGTKRSGHEYGGVQVGTSSGQFSIGINEIVRGDSESFKELIDNILSDMAKLLQDDNVKENRSKLILSIKNMMTDRHIVNSCLKGLLEKMKVECVPNETDTNLDIINKMSAINSFKCNLHVLVNFASQAESGLKLWEQNVIVDDTENMSFYNPSSCDFVRATTKLCVPGADEKSGYGLLFKTFLNQLDGQIDLKLSTFHGHRINLLFAMGANVFYHRSHIKDFIESYFNKEERNRLVQSVYNYLNNPVYLAGCRALGIIDKLLTGPLWRIIENVNHILDLNDTWLVFKNCIELLSKDASELIHGKIFYPEFTNQDEVFHCLFNVEDDELNLLTIEALQIILINFLIIIERQLSDCLPGGCLNEGLDVNKNLREESQTVSSTNIISERDFANLDRLRREKPNANTIALEGIILFSNNKTSKWLNELEETKKAEIFKTARERTPAIIKQFRLRKEEIKRKHTILLKQRQEEKERKAEKKQQEIKKITIDIKKYGGVWLSVSEMYKNLNKLCDQETKLEAIKLNIKFHKKVLKTNVEDKTLLQFSSNTTQFTFDELLGHLKLIISQSCNTRSSFNSDENGNILYMSDDNSYTIKSPDERLAFMEKQRQSVLDKILSIRNKNKSVNCTNTSSNEPVFKRAKVANKCRSSVSSTSNDTMSCSSSYVLPEFSFKCGQYVAVAYSDSWFPGQILCIEDQLIKIKFLHYSKKTCNLFKWPDIDDIQNVENIFIFFSDIEVLPKDSQCRSWTIMNFKEVQEEYRKYSLTYFT